MADATAKPSAIDWINVGATAWNVVKDGKGVASANGASVSARPKGYKLQDLVGGKKIKRPLKFTAFCGIGPGVNVVMQADAMTQVNASKAKLKEEGLHSLHTVQNFTVWCRSCYVRWGWSVDITVNAMADITNRGPETDPVACMGLMVNVTYSDWHKTTSQQVRVLVTGGGFIGVET